MINMMLRSALSYPPRCRRMLRIRHIMRPNCSAHCGASNAETTERPKRPTKCPASPDSYGNKIAAAATWRLKFAISKPAIESNRTYNRD